MTDRVARAFKQTLETISWADDAIREMHKNASAFFARDATTIFTEIDTKTGETVQKMKLAKELPSIIRRNATDALTTAKNSFDQATFAAFNLANEKIPNNLYYPWSTDPTNLEQNLLKYKTDTRLWDTFKSHEPYKRGDSYSGGDNIIRSLAAMANDKHTVGLFVRPDVQRIGFPRIEINDIQTMSMSNPRWDDTKAEMELVRWKGDVKIGSNYKFVFQLFFKSRKFSETTDAVTSLLMFTTKAKLVAESLQNKCFELFS